MSRPIAEEDETVPKPTVIAVLASISKKTEAGKVLTVDFTCVRVEPR